MSYTDLRDFESEFETCTTGGLFIQVEKLGGGTVDKAYDGTWRYIVSNKDGQEIARAQDFETGMPMTHADVASAIAGYFESPC